MERSDIHDPSVDLKAPPQSYPRSGSVVLDMRGRLLALSVVPDSSIDSAASAALDWAAFLHAAGRDPVKVVAVPPTHLGSINADSTVAWRVSDAGAPETTIVAAALHGKVVALDTYAGPTALGDLEVRVPTSPYAGGAQGWALTMIFNVIPLLGGLLLAIRNFRAGRVDMRGALVVAVVTAIFYLLSYLFLVNLGELGLQYLVLNVTGGAPFGHALVHGVLLGLAYLAIEPYIRRLWPRVLVSWARLVSGRVRDPILGRDVLIGSLVGFLFFLSDQGFRWLSRYLGLVTEAPTLQQEALNAMIGPGAILATAFLASAVAILRTTITFTLLVVFRFLLRNNRAAAVALLLVMSLVFVSYEARTAWLEAGLNLAINAIVVFAVLRFGFVMLITAFFMTLMLLTFPWTSDLSTWYASQTIMGWGIVAVILGYGFLTAVGGRSLFRDPLSDPVGVAPRRGT